MRKKKQPPPDDVIVLENHINPEWCFRLNLNESDVRRLSEGTVPDWLQATSAFWCRDNPKPSDVDPQYHPYTIEEAKTVNE